MPHLSTSHALRSLRRFTFWAVSGLALLAALPAGAQEDPPGRVGRLADLNGAVSWFDHEQGNWSAAERNRPLTNGDRLSTGAGARAELRIGSTTVRLGGGSEMEVLRLDDERVVLQLHSGSLALRLRSRESADETEVQTAEARLLPQRAGHYRVDRIDDTTEAGAWRGEWRVDHPGGLQVNAGQRVALTRERGGGLRAAWETMPDDGFANWVAREDQRDERSASSRYVSPEMTGAEDLDRYGRWSTHPEFGAIWYPLEVRSGWEPYRYGRWAWVRPWGWTWIDEAPWGFAPFHYGRWVAWGGRWGWVPGAYVARPVYAPALVAWGSGGGFGVSVNIGSPPMQWAPLAPREVYRPHYRTTPVYVERINPAPPYRWQRPEEGVRIAPVLRDVLEHGRGTPAPQPQPQQPPQRGPGGRPAPAPAPQVQPVMPVVVSPAAPAPQVRPRPDERERQRVPERRPPERASERPPERPAERPAERPPERPSERPIERGHERPAPREGAVGGRPVERPREDRGADEARQRRPEPRGNPRERGENQR